MPFINKNPLISNRPELPKRPDPKIIKKEPKSESLFGGKSQISRYEFKRYLEKNKDVRNELAKELKLKPWSPEMNAEIKKIEERVPKRFGGSIDIAEAKRSVVEEYWNAKYDVKEKMKGGITAREVKEINKRKKEDEFLKRKLGLDKK